GGKGVATAFGAILGLSAPVALAALATWLIMAFVLRISSLSALTAAALTPLFAWYFGLSGASLAVVLVMVGLLIWRHRSNIRHLWAGTEGKIGTDRPEG
ncbi:MAG: glycerol-3-phosphate acyltransferase, partial [Candidatus Competibacter sp.]|nr:glycerol-3-phosphate acyltransferase [Candidatus Competibacter sp.]